jgi:hypothetical protein
MLELRRFSYYFNVKGNTGGLYSISLELVPQIRPEAGEDECRSAARDAFNRVVGEIESLLEKTDVKVKSKTPTFTDSPAGMEAGFEYQTSGMVFTPFRLMKNLFAVMARQRTLDFSLSGWSYGSGRIEVAFRVSKHRTEAVIDLKFSAGHALNLECLGALRALPDLTVSAEAESDLHDLDRTVERYAEGNVTRLIQSI